MPQLDTYSQGTVALFANSTLVVGSGTAWRDADDIVRNVNAGDLFVYGTFVGLIKSVNSPTQLTLVQPYPGASASGLAYDIYRYQQLATPAAIAFMQRERARGGPTAPFVRLDIDTGNSRLSMRDDGNGNPAIFVGDTATNDGSQFEAVEFDESGNVRLLGTGGLSIPAGTTLQRLATEGRFRRNTTTGRVEVYLGSTWRAFMLDGDDIAANVAAPATVTAGTSMTVGGGTVGRARLVPGTTTTPGALEVLSADGTVRALFGNKDASTNRVVIAPANSWGIKADGDWLFANRPTFGGLALWDAGNLGITTPEAFNSSAGTGSDDRAAIQSAINTGRHVLLNPEKEYRTTSPLYVDGQVGQHIIGGILKPQGNFNALIYRGAYSCVLDIAMKCAGMTGGYAVQFIQNSERCTVKKLHALDNAFNLLYVEQCNAITVDWLYGINMRGTRGVRWYGDGSKRSDILTLNFAAIAGLPGNTSLVGIDWDGNCNSLYAQNIHTVNCLNGLLMRNSSGGPPPAIGRLHAFGADFCYANCVSIVAGSDAGYDPDVDFISPYLNGAGYLQAGLGHHGILVDGQAKSASVRVFGGKSIGNRGHAYACNPANSLYVQGSRVEANLEANGFQLHPSSLLLT